MYRQPDILKQRIEVPSVRSRWMETDEGIGGEEYEGQKPRPHHSLNGKSASFKVLSVNGKEAEVSVTTEGITRKGTGFVYKNVIMFGQAQIASDDGQNGKIIYQVGTKSFVVPVTKYPPADSSSSVDKTA